MIDYLEIRAICHSDFTESEKARRKADLKILNQDFFEDLPYPIRGIMDNLRWNYKDQPWFEEAWEKYRKHVLDAGLGGKIKMPGFVFNEYIDRYVDNQEKKMKKDLVHMETCDIDELYHHGVKGQRWGIRRYQNEDGSLTEEGKKRYGISDNDVKIAKKYISFFDKNCYKTPNSKNKEDVVSIIKYDRSRGNKSNRYFNDAIDKATAYLIHHFTKNEKIALSYAYVPGFGDVYVKGPGDFNDDDLKKWFKKSPNKDEILHTAEYEFEDELDLEHHGIKGQRWGIRRYQNEDGTLTAEGRARYGIDENGKMSREGLSLYKQDTKDQKTLDKSNAGNAIRAAAKTGAKYGLARFVTAGAALVTTKLMINAGNLKGAQAVALGSKVVGGILDTAGGVHMAVSAVKGANEKDKILDSQK